MHIIITGTPDDRSALAALVRASLERTNSLPLTTLREDTDGSFAVKAGASASPALCVEEESIAFCDMIFEGMLPSENELDDMFRSIFALPEAPEAGGCGTCSTGGCGTCSSAPETKDASRPADACQTASCSSDAGCC